MAIKRKKLDRAIEQLDEILREAQAFEERYAGQLEQVHPDQYQGALNLLHYLALRHRDIPGLQDDLEGMGVSRLGRAEAHVLASVLAARHALLRLRGDDCPPESPPFSFKQGRKRLKKRTNQLLGKKLKGASTRIMVTLPVEAADDYPLVRDMLVAGMNCARISCAQNGPGTWKRMVDNIARARKATGRSCKVFMDLGGPKVRTGPMAPGPRVTRIRPPKDDCGRIIHPVEIVLVPEEVRAPAGGPELLDSVKQAPVHPRPQPGNGVIPVSPELFAKLEPGFRVALQDARGRSCELETRSREADGVRALCPTSLYIETGIELTLLDREGRARAFGSVGALPPKEQAIPLHVGDTLVLHKDPRPGEPATLDESGNLIAPAHIACTLPEALDDVQVGEPLLLDDGKAGGVIRQVSPEGVAVEITHAKAKGTRLRADKGINLPESRIHLTGLTAKDLEDLHFVAEHADGVLISFVKHPNDVEDLLDHLDDLQADELGVIIKIETRQGFQNLPGILLAAMERPHIGVMIARGDLAVEGGWIHLAQMQEEIMWVCEAAHVPIVWATQVLEGLAKRGQPSRSEISDVAMAERAECVMLNKGPYIIDAIQTLDIILGSVQSYQDKKAPLLPALELADPDPAEVGRALGTRLGRLPVLAADTRVAELWSPDEQRSR
jgi:pyruvate kinase